MLSSSGQFKEVFLNSLLKPSLLFICQFTIDAEEKYLVIVQGKATLFLPYYPCLVPDSYLVYLLLWLLSLGETFRPF